MKEPKFDENVENIYKSLSNEEKAEYKTKEEKFNKSFLVVGVIFIPIIVAVLILCIVLSISEEMYAFLAFGIIISAIIAIMDISILYSSIKIIKASDDIKIKTRIKRLEKQKELKRQETEKQLQKNVYYRLSVDNIKTVTILDSYTELSDKLHAVLNYQEIIQTRVYKFKVDYKNGTSRIITAAENSEEYNVLIPLVNKNTNEQVATPLEKSNVEKIREYKQLLDDGIITQEEFEAKKKELL